jgi:hypothetical protein
MAVTTSRVTVGTTATKLADAKGTDRATGAHVLLVMVGTGPIQIDGANTVSTSTSATWDKTVLSALAFDLQEGEELWGIIGSSTCRVDVIKSGA